MPMRMAATVAGVSRGRAGRAVSAVGGAWNAGDVLFTMEFWPGLADGSITLTFRRWSRPQVKLGGSYRTPADVMIKVTGLKQQRIRSITKADAARCGQPRERLLEYLNGAPDDLVWRIEFERDGEDPRVALREQGSLSDAQLHDVLTRLARLDRASKRGLWTADVLRTIAAQPGVRAPDLAAARGMETAPFKLDVRKLKALGLTESLKIGYRLSPRGRTVLAALDPQ
jgi:hypothetical protein